MFLCTVKSPSSAGLTLIYRDELYSSGGSEWCWLLLLLLLHTHSACSHSNSSVPYRVSSVLRCACGAPVVGLLHRGGGGTHSHLHLQHVTLALFVC